MPTKLKGMTSLEIAIIVAIVLVIAVAVGWYLYTTFVASATGQPRLNVVSAEITGS
jgi:type IV pilus assembly protein PilA